MRPLVRAALAAAAIVAVSRLAEHALPPASAPTPGAKLSASSAASVAAPCPAGSLPDHGACIPVPASSDGAASDRGLAAGEHVPRRPDRPEDARRYRWPVPLAADAAVAPGEGFGVNVSTEPGAVVRAVRLEREEGEAEVVFTGALTGETVITRHTVRDGAELRELLVVSGRLGRVAPGVAVGTRVAPGATLGFAGTGDGARASLHVGVRRLRDGVASSGLSGTELVQDARSVALDPRNALALEKP